ncbi:MAG: hypothetical protein HYW95_00140 [Candidatus Wildermuthbacteria bacterium]|nr:hypothetical protein [Candidatus Wildermuthbacteria bacterium]
MTFEDIRLNPFIGFDDDTFGADDGETEKFDEVPEEEEEEAAETVESPAEEPETEEE